MHRAPSVPTSIWGWRHKANSQPSLEVFYAHGKLRGNMFQKSQDCSLARALCKEYKAVTQPGMIRFTFRLPDQKHPKHWRRRWRQHISKLIHTPTNHTEFKDVFSDVGVEHLDKGQVHVECFQAHPCEWNQEKVVKKHSHWDAEASTVVESDPWIQEEDQVQQEQSSTQLDENFGRIIPPDLSKRKRAKKKLTWLSANPYMNMLVKLSLNPLFLFSGEHLYLYILPLWIRMWLFGGGIRNIKGSKPPQI